MTRIQAERQANERNSRDAHYVHIAELLYGNEWGVKTYVRKALHKDAEK